MQLGHVPGVCGCRGEDEIQGRGNGGRSVKGGGRDAVVGPEGEI